MTTRSKIFGYTNPSGVFPSPLITIINENNIFWACYPSLKKLKIQVSENEIFKLDAFIFEEGCKFISEFEYSFGISDKYILTETPKQMINKLFLIYKNNCDKEINYWRLEKYLLSELKNPNTDTSDLDYLKFVRVLLTNRIKKNKSLAKRIIIQVNTKTGFKTFFKKNINEPISDFSIYIENKVGQLIGDKKGILNYY